MTDLARALLEWRDAGGPVEDVVDAIRAYVIELKSCLAPSHIACERCLPGFNERMDALEKRNAPTVSEGTSKR